MDLRERMKQVVGQGVATTRHGIEVAAEKAREVGEKGALKVEILRLEREIERKLAQLGGHVYHLVAEEGQASVSAESPEVQGLAREVKELHRRLEDKEKAFALVGKAGKSQ
jgi:hypothetical protein